MLNVYLSGEIHTDWRDVIRQGTEALGLDITYLAPDFELTPGM